ncbi:MAG: hypothetical protein NZ949_02985 [Candidatus Kapabacteria bacterium]|nr:hypothetical protein [Candidatus Kapabacteria bacterium]MDW7997250.1 hypothetical protein [Bacteroidota bacterium]
MYWWMVAGFVLGVGSMLSGCSEEGTFSDASVEISTQLGASSVGSVAKSVKFAPAGWSGVDSLQVTRVRILVRRLKLHSVSEDTASEGRDLKLGPFVAVFTSQRQTLSITAIPPGVYRWLNLGFHRLSDSEAAQYAADPLFRDFVMPERYSVLIEGRVFRGDSAIPFVYRSEVMANVAVEMDPPASATQTELLRLLVLFEPRQVFVEGNIVLDPRDPRLRSLIENKLRGALKALR